MYRIIFLALFLAGCSLAPRTDFNSNIDYDQYVSYQFVNAEAPRTLDGQRIENALNSQLPIKGIQSVDGDLAPLMIQYRIDDETELQSYGTSIGFGYTSRNAGIGMSTPERYREVKYGKLVIEFIDTETNQIIWQAISQNRLTESMSPIKREAFITKQVEQMLLQYPPQ